MKIHLVLCYALALFITTSAASPDLQCDYRSYEFLCLVRSSCIAGGNGERNTLVVLDPGTTLNDGTCDVIIKFKNQDDFVWRIVIDYKDISFNSKLGLAAKLGDRSLFECTDIEKADDDSTEFYRFPVIPHKDTSTNHGYSWSGICSYVVYLKTPVEMRTVFNQAAAPFHLYYEFNNMKHDLIFTGDMNQLTLDVALTRGCNVDLIRNKEKAVTGGAWITLDLLVVGRDAEIKCNGNKADHLSIQFKSVSKNSPDIILSDWLDVNGVFCSGHTWALIQNDTSEVEYLGTRKFNLRCVRNFCTYCGTILDDICHNCEKIKSYKHCMPKCPDNLWYFGGGVVQSELTCKSHPDNDKRGVWMAKSNGVDVPVEMASCYVGKYPVPPEIKTKSSRAVASWLFAIFFTAILA